MNLFKRILPDIVVIILFAVISFAYFFPAVTEGRILSQHDSVAGIGAGEEAKEYLERTGERTRWTNSIFGGMPTYQMAPSYDSTDTLKGVEKLYHLYLPNYVWYVFVMLLGFYIIACIRFLGLAGFIGGCVVGVFFLFFHHYSCRTHLEICNLGLYSTHYSRYGIGL